MKSRVLTVISALTAVLTVTILAGCLTSAAPEKKSTFTGATKSGDPFLVGVAKRDTTPTKENGMLPIAGIGQNVGDIVDVIDNVYTRVMAIQSGGKKALIIVTETGKGPTGWQYAAEVSKHTGIPVEAIFYTTTHDHAVPEEKNKVNFDFAPGAHENTKQLWAKYVLDQMLAAADEALSNMQPASVGIAYGESYINTNRNRTYINRQTGESYINLGYNPTGVSDKTLVTLRFDDQNGKPLAFIINYAVHAVTMMGNTYFNGETGISGDVPGHVMRLLEGEHDGAVVFWTSGAAGDQNPISSNLFVVPAPETGEQFGYFTGDYDIMKYWASIHYADILATLDKIKQVTPNFTMSYAEGETSIPNEKGSDPAEFALHLKVLRIGDIAFVGSPAELFTSIGMYMKDQSILNNTIVVNHTWTQEEAYTGYLFDDYARVNGGYGGGGLVYQTGYINNALADLMNDLISQTEGETL
jgi:hypothetical protein